MLSHDSEGLPNLERRFPFFRGACRREASASQRSASQGLSPSELCLRKARSEVRNQLAKFVTELWLCDVFWTTGSRIPFSCKHMYHNAWFCGQSNMLLQQILPAAVEWLTCGLLLHQQQSHKDNAVFISYYDLNHSAHSTVAGQLKTTVENRRCLPCHRWQLSIWISCLPFYLTCTCIFNPEQSFHQDLNIREVRVVSTTHDSVVC